jgi:hypothetical protein
MILNLSILDHPDKIINPLVKRELTEKIVEQIKNPAGMNVLVKPIIIFFKSANVEHYRDLFMTLINITVTYTLASQVNLTKQ